MSQEAKPIYQFGPFRLDVEQRSLFRDGQSVPLTPKALETLLRLVEKNGKLVEKDELIKQVWPDTFVEESSLTFNISVLRKTLGDDRHNGNRYIETVPKRGYRFIAPVLPADCGAREVASEEKLSAKRQLAATRPSLILLGAATLAAAALLLYLLGQTPRSPRILGYTQLTRDGWRKAGIITDGLTLYISEVTGAGSAIAQVSISGGETVRLPIPFETCGAFDVSPHRQELLLGGSPCGKGMSLWAQPRLGGSPRRIGDVIAHGASWSPGGRMIAYHRDQDIYVADADGSHSRRIVTFPARLGIPSTGPRWSPDGKILRFETADALSRQYSLWEVSPDGSNLHEPLPGWQSPRDVLGNWTPDGKYYAFSFSTNGRNDIWGMREGWHRRPVQLTHGPLDYASPLPAADGRHLFAIGSRAAGELVRWDARLGEFVRFLGGISAYAVSFSRDNQWVAYLKFPEATLWCMRPDGSTSRQLTFAPMNLDAFAWSPDGKQIALRASKPGSPLKIYLISAQGGSPKELLPQHRQEEGTPTWSNDGWRIAFGDVPPVFEKPTGREVIHLFDLKRGQLSSLPDSSGLWTSRWSPDGRYIAALTISKQELVVFDFQIQQVARSKRWRR